MPVPQTASHDSLVAASAQLPNVGVDVAAAIDEELVEVILDCAA